MNGATADRDGVAAALGGLRGSAIGIGAFSAAINALLLTPSIYMLQVYDRALASGNGFTLLMLTLVAAGLLALLGALEYARSRVVIDAGSRLDDRLGLRVYEAAFERGLAGGQAQADQAGRDLDSVRQFLTGSAVPAFFDAPWCPIFLLVMFLFHPWLGALAVAGIVLLSALAWLNDRAGRRLLAEAGQLADQASRMADDQLRSAGTVEAMGMLGRLSGRWNTVHRGAVRRQAVASERSARIGSLSKSLRLLLQSLALGVGAWLAIENRISPGMMIAGSILMGRVLGPIDQVIAAWRQWSGTRRAWERTRALLGAHPPRPARQPLPPPSGELHVDGVTALPPGASAAAATLVAVTFSLRPGEILGVVGPSGSGKSTLARVLTGVWPARVGTVRLDGADIRQWDRDRLGQYVGYLPQEVDLFAGSVAENIARFAADDADPQQVVEAAQLAGAHAAILALPGGYDTVLGPGGQGLSGGQRQRIALARAVYGTPRLVVLDEPNASLDEEGEQALLACLQRLRQRGAAVVVATHRPRVLEAATRLLALKAGRVVACGPTAEVLGRVQADRPAPAAAPAAVGVRAAAVPFWSARGVPAPGDPRRAAEAQE